MTKRIVFRNMEKTAHMEEYCDKKLAKIVLFLEKEDRFPINLDLVLEPSKVHAHHKAELRVTTPDFHKISHQEGSEFYEVLDRVIDTMYKELHEEKRKLQEHRREFNREHDPKKE